MSANYGRMCSFDDAIKWAEQFQTSEEADWAIARMKYERDKALPVEPKALKGPRYVSYSCGNCGSGIPEAVFKYCPECGRRITDAYLGRRKTKKEQRCAEVTE